MTQPTAYYVCGHCGHLWRQPPRPDECHRCGHTPVWEFPEPEGARMYAQTVRALSAAAATDSYEQ